MTTTPQPGRAAVERCDLSDLPIASCGCRKHRPDGGQVHVEAAVKRAAGHIYRTENGGFPARYPGRCPECGERYEVGDLIAPQRFKSIDLNTGSYAHLECAEEAS